MIIYTILIIFLSAITVNILFLHCTCVHCTREMWTARRDAFDTPVTRQSDGNRRDVCRRRMTWRVHPHKAAWCTLLRNINVHNAKPVYGKRVQRRRWECDAQWRPSFRTRIDKTSLARFGTRNQDVRYRNNEWTSMVIWKNARLPRFENTPVTSKCAFRECEGVTFPRHRYTTRARYLTLRMVWFDRVSLLPPQRLVFRRRHPVSVAVRGPHRRLRKKNSRIQKCPSVNEPLKKRIVFHAIGARNRLQTAVEFYSVDLTVSSWFSAKEMVDTKKKKRSHWTRYERYDEHDIFKKILF